MLIPPLALRTAVSAALALGCVVIAEPARADADGDRRVHTYSIVARDAKTGEIGVAVHSHWFQVGRLVAWAEPGVGAVATQALTNPSFGPRGLALLARGGTPDKVIDKLLASDDKRDQRQVAIVDSAGRTAAWTGKRCIAAAGHLTAEGFSVQANMMATPAVWGAMARAYRQARDEPLAERLLAALRAAQRAGGDLRGRQSAALVVVRGKPTDKPWTDRLIDLRVADHRRPLAELSRLLNMRRAYDAFSAAGEALAQNRIDVARRGYAQARRRLPRRIELRFWQALALHDAGEKRAALRLFGEVFRQSGKWRRVLRRLPAAKLIAAADVAAILAHTRKRARPQSPPRTRTRTEGR